jgi:hypothetical protein
MKQWVIIVLLLVVFLIVLKRRVSGLSSGGTSCSPCPAKAAGTYYTYGSGCATAACGSVTNCPNVANATKTITPCADGIANLTNGSPGNCGFTCNSGYTQSGNGCVAAKNCAVSWGPWGACSVTCGAGTQTRTGTITQQPEPGGQACPANLTESQGCTGPEGWCSGGKDNKVSTNPVGTVIIETPAAQTVAIPDSIPECVFM